MESRIVLSAVFLVFALAFGSGDALKCYQCRSSGGAADTCTGEMVKNRHDGQIECSLETMRAWSNVLRDDTTISRIANVFDVFSSRDTSHHRDPLTPMACIKMNLRVGNEPVTVRTCQTAKTAEVDPCKITRDKIAESYNGGTTVEYCGMCEGDLCNGSYALSPTMILSIVPLIGSILMSLVYNSA